MTPQELFRLRMAGLGPFKGTAIDYWKSQYDWVRSCAANRDPDTFLSWGESLDAQPNPGMFNPWYQELREHDWPRWERLTRVPPYGGPKPFGLDPGASYLTVQHAHYFCRYEKTTGRRFLDDVDCVVEFGGGCGDVARMLRVDGFQGPHIILDLPHMREVQRMYLALCGVEGVELRTEADSWEDFPSGNIAFIAAWSLSEAPLELRARLFPALHKRVSKYLISTQWPRCLELDNESYFTQFMQDSGANWHVEPVQGHTTERYLFGWNI